MKDIILAIAVLACVYTATAKTNYQPCAEARKVQSNSERHCGNNGNIYPNKHAFECAKLTNSRLRRISCNDSLILAKNALRNIQEQNQNGQLLTQKEKVEKLRQRHEEQQRQRQLEQAQRQG